MTRSFDSLRPIAALSVTITLLTAPIAAAQSRDAAPPLAAPANTALLSPAAFARLVQLPPASVAPAAVATDSPRPSLLRQADAAMAREAQAAPAKTTQQKSWPSRHKGAVAAIILGAIGLVCLPGFINLAKQ